MKDNPSTIEKYKDILYLKHPTSMKHPRMSMINRAAQFAPFAALTGYDAAIAETARLTDSKINLTEDQKDTLNMKFQILEDNVGKDVSFTVTYFVPDNKKDGGAYHCAEGFVKKIDFNKGYLTFANGNNIDIQAIVDIQSDLYKTYGLDYDL